MWGPKYECSGSVSFIVTAVVDLMLRKVEFPDVV